ncbi:hypothetical protein LUZ60_017269 [Juncus effusus]|nr:hypothetical protein LUZ60_017269 [Juncus effusus]
MLTKSPIWAAAVAALRFRKFNAGRGTPAAAAAEEEAVGMEEEKIYEHYNHTDACRMLRWTSRESFEYMYERRWEKIVEFYANLVQNGNGASDLSQLFKQKHDLTIKSSEIQSLSNQESVNSNSKEKKNKGGRWERNTFKIILSYHGGSFDGWQKQPNLNTVQALVEKSLGKFVDEQKLEKLKEKKLPIEGCAVVAGRTDKGVSALQQVCSFYTWRKDVKCEEIRDAINEASHEKLKVVSVTQVTREFHPNFSAKWRRYLYIFPLDEQNHQTNINKSEFYEGKTVNLPETKPKSFSVKRVDGIFRQLEGKLMSYKNFARDTPASRSTGPATECFMFHSRATETVLPSTNLDSDGTKVMCVELVADRFLRKMVRVLVATAIREAVAGADSDALIKLMGATCRRATAPPAPPDGLSLVDVGYADFQKDSCFIQS